MHRATFTGVRGLRVLGKDKVVGLAVAGVAECLVHGGEVGAALGLHAILDGTLTGGAGFVGNVIVETLAAALSEARDAVEDVIEPYLMQKGYVARTPRGRVAAPLAYERLGLPNPGGQQSGLFGEK